jgi:two-component SAPR family response regulator
VVTFSEATISPTLHTRLLGDFSVTYRDEAVAGINTPRLHSLFAYLWFHRETLQLRQHVAFVFWPDTNEAEARNNLRQVLHQLRYALPDFGLSGKYASTRCDREYRGEVSLHGYRQATPRATRG